MSKYTVIRRVPEDERDYVEMLNYSFSIIEDHCSGIVMCDMCGYTAEQGGACLVCETALCQFCVSDLDDPDTLICQDCYDAKPEGEST